VRSNTTPAFWEALGRLPQDVQAQARGAYQLFKANPAHPSLHFKPLNLRQPIWSVRIGIGYRALAHRDADKVTWFWIGPHSEYDKLIGRR
jgi:hypothetical protein